MGGAVPDGVPATADSANPDLCAEELKNLHFFGRPTDSWASARVGRILVVYTAGLVIFACKADYSNMAWDVACDLYLPPGRTIDFSTDFVYCPTCDREFYYFEL